MEHRDSLIFLGGIGIFPFKHGHEFIATALEIWAKDHNVELLFIQSGKSIWNALSNALMAQPKSLLDRCRVTPSLRYENVPRT